MRPLKLKMKAFGPYASETVIDFDKIGKSGLYLVTGETGSGKTTIFDAISYALYGRASGQSREPSMLRSMYADADTATEVELTFEYRGEIYNIKRNPEYERPKKRGEGITKEGANAELLCPDGRFINKREDVDREIIDIMGIDQTQFSQIVMIAQGDFLKLLLSSTDERIKIFRRLFNTTLFQSIQDRLKDELKKLSDECLRLRESIRQYIEGIKCKNEVFEQKVETVKTDFMPLDDVACLLEEIIKSDTEDNDKLINKINELDLSIRKSQTKLAIAEENEKARETLKKNKEIYKVEEERLKKLKDAFENAKKDYEQSSGLDEKIASLETKLPDYTLLSDAKKTSDNIIKEISKYEEFYKSKKEKFDKLSMEIEKKKGELSNYELAETKLLKAESEAEKLSLQKNELESIETEIKEYNEKILELKTAQEEYLKISLTAEEKKNTYILLNKSFLDEQAGIIAMSLEDNKPCPVCGSLGHPTPASISQNAPTKEEVEKMGEEADGYAKMQNQASEKASGLKILISDKKKSVLKMISRSLGDFKIEEVSSQIEVKLTQLKDETEKADNLIKKLKNECRRKEELKCEIPETEAEIKKLESEISKIREEISVSKENQKNISRRIFEIQKDLEYNSSEEAETQVKLLKKKKKDMEDNLDSARESYNECDKKLSTVSGIVSELEKQLERAEVIDIFEEKKKNLKLSDEKEELQREKEIIFSYISANKECLKNISDQKDILMEKEENLKWVKALCDTANGSITGKEKIMLETYVQIGFFDRIINKANKRFMMMSDGKYELVRRCEPYNIRTKTGLDLDVIDHYNGSVRSVKSLSGGESFIASLSLALGLSDEIQSNAGGIKIDTMFVDEGFGTLSEDVLSQAIKTLVSLSEGDRLVGIISHVAELKEKIEKQIVITKEKTGGSCARVLC